MGRKAALTYVIGGAAEVSWFSAWSMFLSSTLLHRPFPFVEAIVCFALAAALTRLSAARGWRVATIVVLQATGFACAALLILHRLYPGAESIAGSNWILSFLTTQRSAQDWIILLVNLALVTTLWVTAAMFQRRPRTYYAVCARFDFGMAAFFVLFLVRLVALAKGGIQTDDTAPLLFLFPFFVFSLVSIVMAHIEEQSLLKSFIPGYRGAGIIASFVAAVILGAGGLVLFFLPALHAAARTGYGVLKIAAAPVGYFFIGAVRFMFMPRGNRSDAAAESSRHVDWSTLVQGPKTWFSEILEKVLGWGLISLVLFLLVIVTGVVCFYAVRWLFSKTPGAERAGTTAPRRLSWRMLTTFMAQFCRNIALWLRQYQSVSELYNAVVKWAQRSGCRHVKNETPTEFSKRLYSRFPALQHEIALIAALYNREAYGALPLTPGQFNEAHAAWRSMRRPAHWPSRARSLLFNAASQEEEQ